MTRGAGGFHDRLDLPWILWAMSHFPVKCLKIKALSFDVRVAGRSIKRAALRELLACPM